MNLSRAVLAFLQKYAVCVCMRVCVCAPPVEGVYVIVVARLPGVFYTYMPEVILRNPEGLRNITERIYWKAR